MLPSLRWVKELFVFFIVVVDNCAAAFIKAAKTFDREERAWTIENIADEEKEEEESDTTNRRTVEIGVENFEYWPKKGAVWCELASFAQMIMEAVVTEAAVERSYSAQALTFTKLRAKMREDTAEAQLWLKINYKRLNEQ